MQIINNVANVIKDKNTILTLGTFDGIHLGHQEIIKKMINISSEKGLRNFVVTFHPHPRRVVSPKQKIKLLSLPEEQEKILKKLGVENLLVINFTKEFSQLSPQQFIEKYLVEILGVNQIVIGYDHHFGKGRGGNVSLLEDAGRKFDFDVIEIPPFLIDGESVSSTKIRNALEAGAIEFANKMLGRYYSFSGKVVAGDKRGRELGYPTANIKMGSEDKLLPALGIYAVKVKLGENNYAGLLSIGKRPTFYEQGEIIPEVYIYDFDQEIYGSKVEIGIIARLRGEEKFNSAEELISQMDKDKENGLKILNKIIN